MSYQAIKECLTAIERRYKNLNKQGKTQLLNDATQVTQLTRKHLIRLLSRPAEELVNKKSSGRRRKYLPEVFTPHVAYLWIQMERISGRRMKAAYPDWLPFYDHPDCTPAIQIGLQEMSASTLERLLRGIRGELRASKGLSTTCPARFMKNKVPLNTFNSKIDRPGFCQTDTVAHCGNSTEGTYCNSITLRTGVQKAVHPVKLAPVWIMAIWLMTNFILKVKMKVDERKNERRKFRRSFKEFNSRFSCGRHIYKSEVTTGS